MNKLDLIFLLLVNLAQSKSFIGEVVHLSLQVLDLRILLHLELLRVDLLLKVAQFFRHHAHVSTVRIDEVFLLGGLHSLHELVKLPDPLVNTVHVEDNSLSLRQILLLLVC